MHEPNICSIKINTAVKVLMRFACRSFQLLVIEDARLRTLNQNTSNCGANKVVLRCGCIYLFVISEIVEKEDLEERVVWRCFCYLV